MYTYREKPKKLQQNLLSIYALDLPAFFPENLAGLQLFMRKIKMIAKFFDGNFQKSTIFRAHFAVNLQLSLKVFSQRRNLYWRNIIDINYQFLILFLYA